MHNEKQKLKQLCIVRNVLAVVWVLLLIALIASFFLVPKAESAEASAEATEPTGQTQQTAPETTAEPTETGEVTGTDDIGVEEATISASIPGQNDNGSQKEPPANNQDNNSAEPVTTAPEDPPQEPEGGTLPAPEDPTQEPEGSDSTTEPTDAVTNHPPQPTVDGSESTGATEDEAAGAAAQPAGMGGLIDTGDSETEPGSEPNADPDGALDPNSTTEPATEPDGIPGGALEPLPSAQETAAPTTEAAAAETEEEPEADGWLMPLRWILLALLLLDTAAVVVLTLKISALHKQIKIAAASRRRQQAPAPAVPPVIAGVSVGKLHNVGARPSQQDSFGVDPIPGGAFAVVADGMGGLSGGEKVSQKIVTTMLSHTADLLTNQPGNPLNGLVQKVNDEVNRMLGVDGQYKSGSTLVSVLVRGDRFHWISVGDSRIYLYRGGSLIQINQEHTYGQELLRQAMDGQISFEQARSDPQRHKLTSFIGMGRLRYVDASLNSVPLSPGDRILLMSDGVFNTLPEQTMAAILAAEPDVQRAAQRMEEQILNACARGQDNFTAVILGV